jgi:hypothetical protein
MRGLRLAASAIACAAWLSVAFAQAPPPAGTPPPRTPPTGTPPPSTPPPSTPPPSTPPADRPPVTGAPDQEAGAKPPEKEENDTFVPTEELQPDAAVTFPVDI